MKRTIWLVVLLATCTIVSAQVQVKVGSVNAAAGSKVIVPLSISEGQAISALQFDLAFDTTVLTLPDSKAVLTGDSCLDHGIVSNLQAGTLKVAVFSGSLSLLKPGSGTVVELIFDVASGASQGKTAAMTLSNVKACDATGAAVSTSATNGIVTISSAANQPAAGQNFLVFPQIANGAVGQGSFYTIVILINQTNAPVFAQVRFFRSNGSAFPVTLITEGSGSLFAVTVNPGGSVYLQTDGTGPLAAGYAQVDASGPLGGTAMFGWRGPTGATVTEAGVGAADKKTEFCVPVIYSKDSSSTGIAAANAGTTSIELTVKLKDTSGATLGTATLALAAGQQKACYVHEQDLFPSLAAQTNFVGTMHISAPKGVAVTAVKQSMQEGLITTFPIVEMK